MAHKACKVELTGSFLKRLAAIEKFLTEVDAHFAYDDLLAELRATIIPNLTRFPEMGRKYLERAPQSIEALNQLARLPAGGAHSLREYLSGDYLLLYAYVADSEAVWLLSIRHHRQHSFDDPLSTSDRNDP